MSASALWKPNARRVISRIWVLIASTRALERPCSMAATMPVRWALIVLASLTKDGSRQRRAQAIQPSSSAIAGPGSRR